MAKEKGSCDLCARYEMDDETGEYVCDVSMDEDEYLRFLQGSDCPYFILDDEYKIVRRQNGI